MSYNLSYFLVDKHFRLYHKIKSRIKVLTKYFEYINDNHEISKNVVINYNQDIDTLNSYLINLNINNSIHNNLICNKDTVYKDIYKKFQLFPNNHKDHVKKLFGQYTKANYDSDFKLRCLIKKRDAFKAIYLSRPSDRLRESIEKVEKEIQSEQSMLNYIKFSLDNAATKASKSRKNNMMVRLSNEVHLRKSQGWFFVFNTLTVRREHYDRVFSMGSSCWTDYVRNCDRAVGITEFGSWRKALDSRRKGSEFHTYFAVVERGGTTGRLHIHVLHMMKTLPSGCVDPNAGLTYPYNRCIQKFYSFWKFGNSSPVAVRFDSNDAYAKLFWRWPVAKIQSCYEPLPFKPVVGLIKYLGKYLTKSYERKNMEDNLSWKVRISRNLGMQVLKQSVSLMSNSQLIFLMKMKGTRIFKIKDKTIPSLLMIRLAVKEYLRRRWHALSVSKNYKNSKSNLSLWAFLKSLIPLPNLLVQLKNSIQKSDDLNSLNSIVSTTRNIPGTVVFKLQELFNNYIDKVFSSVIVCTGQRGSYSPIFV